MGKTSIEWAHYTFNPWWGCEKVSAGCQQCYAESLSNRYGHHVWGKDAPRRFFSAEHWQQPVRWNDEAQKLGIRYRVFCASMADVCENRPDLIEPRERLKQLIIRTPLLDWLLLTKRPENFLAYFGRGFFIDNPHAWPGTTTENQEQADKRIQELLFVPGLQWLSIEPMLERVDLWSARYRLPGGGLGSAFNWGKGVRWVVYGGESGNKARGFNEDWVRAGIAECRAAEVAVFVKQFGSRWARAMQAGNAVRGFNNPDRAVAHRYDNKGGDMAEWPEDLRVREFPNG